MAKPPPNTPAGVIGERVTLRANKLRSGTIRAMTQRLWLYVDWDDGHPAPKIVHQYELMNAEAKG